MSVEGQPITVLSVYTSFAWIQPVGGSNFTKAQADTLYLRKTVADTATALETFNGGLLVENTADFNGNVNVYQSRLTLKDNAISPSSTITLSPTTPGAYINITSYSNQVELLTGMLSFNNDGSVQVGATKNLTLGTIDANVALGSVGKATTLNGTITVNGTINNYARLNASQAFSASQAFTGGVYNIFASTIGGNVGQTTQSLFANTANSTIALGSSSTVNLDGTLQITSGSTQIKFNINGISQDDDYTQTLYGKTSSLTPYQLTFYDRHTSVMLDMANTYITMDSNNMGSTGYMTEILNDKTQSKMTFSNKSGNNSVAITHTGILASTASSSTTYGVGSITSTSALSIQAAATGIINVGTTTSRTADINIGIGMTSGNINVGAGTSILDVSGSGVKFDTLSTNNPTLTQNLYSNKTGGTLGIAPLMSSGNINVGTTGSTTKIRGNFQVDAPITPNYTYPVASEKIGSYIQNATIVTNPLTGIGQPICSVAVPSKGIYMLTFQCQVNGTISTLHVGIRFTPTTTGSDPLVCQDNIGYTTMVIGAYYGIGNTCMCAPTASGTYNLQVTGINNSLYVNSSYICAVRIA